MNFLMFFFSALKAKMIAFVLFQQFELCDKKLSGLHTLSSAVTHSQTCTICYALSLIHTKNLPPNVKM